MDFSNSETKLLIQSINHYRATLFHLVKDMESQLDEKSALNLKKSIAILNGTRDKILERISQDTHIEQVIKEKSSARVLIADDDQITAELVRNTLEDSGFSHIDLAKDGQEAIDKISNGTAPYDLIVCDWKMPNHSGLEVHKKVQEHIEDTVFILLSAVSDDVLKSRALKQGITEYIVKPFDIDVFDKLLKTYFK